MRRPGRGFPIPRSAAHAWLSGGRAPRPDLPRPGFSDYRAPNPGKRAASRAYRAPVPSALPWANLLRAKNPVPITPSARQWRQPAATAAAPDEKENRWRH